MHCHMILNRPVTDCRNKIGRGIYAVRLCVLDGKFPNNLTVYNINIVKQMAILS